MIKGISLDQFSKCDHYKSLTSGSYVIEYNDNTHLAADDWRRILRIEIQDTAAVQADADFGETPELEASFSIKIDLDEKFSDLNFQLKSKEKIKPEDKAAAEKQAGINISRLGDAISLSVLRMGLIQPKINSDTALQILELTKSRGLVLIPDTNSLYNGTLHWLLNVLRESSVWLLPFVMSLTQMQAREATLKGLTGAMKASNISQALRSRALVSAGLGLLERNRHRYQVMELDPSLLRYMRTGGKGGFDQDEGEVLEDRLLIEGVHSILRTSRTRATQLVVTSDVLLARVLGAEGIPYVCLPTPMLGSRTVASIRYDSWARTYVGTSLRGLLWDLTHTFASIRIRPTTKPQSTFTLACYWPGKMPRDWISEHLLMETVTDASADVDVGAANTAPLEADVPVNAAATEPPAKARIERRAARAEIRDAARPYNKPPANSFSEASLPQASLPWALKIASVIYQSGRIPFAEIMNAIPKDLSSSKGNILRALEVLRRANLIHSNENYIISRPELDAVDSNLRSGDLDQISLQFENFEPYRIVMQILREKGFLLKEEIQNDIQARIGSFVASEASIRLIRYHILLGQCWSDQGKWLDGSKRPTADQLVAHFDVVFNRVSDDNIAKMSDFLPELCREARISPWAAQRLSERHARRLSESYAFQFAVGGKPVGGDSVLSGSLVALNEVTVPLDRIEIGGRPVLTLGRVKQ